MCIRDRFRSPHTKQANFDLHTKAKLFPIETLKPSHLRLPHQNQANSDPYTEIKSSSIPNNDIKSFSTTYTRTKSCSMVAIKTKSSSILILKPGDFRPAYKNQVPRLVGPALCRLPRNPAKEPTQASPTSCSLRFPPACWNFGSLALRI